MHSHSILRLLFAGLTFALMAVVLLKPAGAAERTTWTDTSSPEAQLVQSCDGFGITTSYTVNRVHNLIEEYAHEVVIERQQVDFTGAMANSKTGLSYAYDGHYTTVADLDKGTNSISNLQLRFGAGTPGQFSVSLAKVDFKLVDSPPAVVQAIVPNVLQRDLCGLFAGSIVADYAPMPPTTANVHTENSTLPQPVILPANYPLEDDMISDPSQALQSAEVEPAAADTMTNWSELDPCDTSPPGQPC